MTHDHKRKKSFQRGVALALAAAAVLQMVSVAWQKPEDKK